MPQAAKIAIGALLGAALGYILGRATTCRSGACSARPARIYTIVAGAFFGAAVGYWL